MNVEIEWIDDGTNDEADTKLASTYNRAIRIPVNVHFSQYLGEEINEYVEEPQENI